MLAHASIGVGDIAAARRFYDPLMATLGYRCLSSGETWLGYGADTPVFWLLASERPVVADMKSGLHFCFDAPSRAAVDAFHAAGLKGGGRDNGRPGLRPDYDANYYAAYLIDPDGYRIEAWYGKAA